MNIRLIFATLVAALMAAGTFVGLNPASATSGPPTARPAKTVFFDAMYTQHVAPKRIFTTADAGRWMKNLHWEGWGTGKAVAHGIWISDCASCTGPDRRRVTFTFSKRVYCAHEGVYAYRKGHGVLSEPDYGDTDTTFSFATGCPG